MQHMYIFINTPLRPKVTHNGVVEVTKRLVSKLLDNMTMSITCHQGTLC